MAEARGRVLRASPFPQLRWDEYFWVSEDVLPSWAGFQARRGGYGTRSSSRPSSGRVTLTIDADTPDKPVEHLAEMQAAYAHLKSHEPKVARTVLAGIYRAYPGMQRLYGYGEAEAAVVMPDLDQPGDLRRLIGLHSVHFLAVSKGGVGCVGFEFACSWDGEHGLGVMTHKGRVTDVGGADTSFLEWIAKRAVRRRRASRRKP